jgi:hypothetical protein
MNARIFDQRRVCKRIRIFFWCAALALGAVDLWASRNAINPDGVSYLDMGDAFFRRNWHMAVNSYWSPLYPWIEGFFQRLQKPSPRWEFPLVHVVNLLIYLGALASFDYFLRSFIHFHNLSRCSPSLSRLPERGDLDEIGVGEGADNSRGLYEWACYVLGYSLFIWTAVIMIGATSNVSPDLCVAALVFLASGLLLRMRGGTANWGTFVLFGAVLGIGYLAKAVMFPLAFVFLAVAFFSLSSFRKAVPRILVSAAVFAAIASPWVIALSRAEGRLTFGDTGRINYECYVDGYALWFPRALGLKHPVSKLIDNPPTYDFAEPVGGTYPLWYDPTYWHKGLTPRFTARGESKAVAQSLEKYVHLVLSPRLQFYLVVDWLLLFWLSGWRLNVKAIGSNWPVIIPALAAAGGYLLIVTDLRYVAAYVAIAWMVLFSGVKFPASGRPATWAAAVILALGLFSFYRPLYSEVKTRVPAYWQAAAALNNAGVRPGDRIAVIGPETFGMYVARLAKTRIIAQVREPASRFSREQPAVQTRVIEALKSTGATAVLASANSPHLHPDGDWRRLANTPYSVYLLAGANP